MDFFIASFLSGIADFFIKGGLFMFFLMALSVCAVTVIILRALALRQGGVLPAALSAEIERLEPGESLDKLQKLIPQYPSPLARVLDTLVKHLTWPRSEVIEAVQTRARHEVSGMEKGLVILEIATGVAPLLGLLGTLSGLVGIFASIGADPVAVARGIAEALNTTIVGLAVAVPCMVMYNYFQRRIEVMAVEMESLVSDLIAKCYPQGATPTILKITK
ncbi:MAG: MotA/TolQ/ExbB proton channel family protein [Terrimicrobiaceae bacterium]